MSKQPNNSKTKPTILIVEDDAATSKLLSHHLQKYGRVITTKNAREAIANNSVCNPDIIFLDVHYHDDIYDGFDVLRNILSTDKDAFVVMFSADNNPENSEKAIFIGAKGFIYKPFHADDFIHYISQYNSR